MSVSKVNLFDGLDYQEAKEKIEEWVFEIQSIEKQVSSKVIFQDNVFVCNHIIEKIGMINKCVKVTASVPEKVQTSKVNHIEAGMITFINEKDEMKKTAELFFGILNEFDENYRLIIYHLFYKRRSNIALSQELNMSIGKLEIMKRKYVIEVAEALELEELMYKLSA